MKLFKESKDIPTLFVYLLLFLTMENGHQVTIFTNDWLLSLKSHCCQKYQNELVLTVKSERIKNIFNQIDIRAKLDLKLRTFQRSSL